MRLWLCLSWFSYRKHNQSNSSIRLGIWANGNKGRDFKIFQLSVSVDFLNLHVPTCLGLISTSCLLVCAIFHRLGAHQDSSKKVSSESVIAARVLWKTVIELFGLWFPLCARSFVISSPSLNSSFLRCHRCRHWLTILIALLLFRWHNRSEMVAVSS